MDETRTITIESPIKTTLSVQVEADLVDRFVQTVTDKDGPWRNEEELSEHALERAVTDALIKFLDKATPWGTGTK